MIGRFIAFLIIGAGLPMAAIAGKPGTPASKPSHAAVGPASPAPAVKTAVAPGKSASRAAAADSASVTFAIAPAPGWVRSYAVDPAARNEEQADGGISYLLVDRQENLEPSAAYYHEARRITSDHGVQNGASISVSFDPSYQRLTFHTLRLVRDGVILDRLVRSQIKLLQREEEMESFLYDGSYTADCQVEDVRVGDIIEYAYTVEGANPVLRGKFFNVFATEWSVPMQRAVARFVYPAPRKLNFLIKNRNIRPRVTTEKGVTEWLWDESGIAPREMDAHTPRGYNPYGLVQVSEFSGWQEVVDWALPLYESKAPLSPEFEKQITALRAIEQPEERILAALRFVQDEIRYLGIESGVGSHQPTAPSEVLRRRFGDCKDKTLMLATLVRHAGFTATPALVSTGLRSYITERLPSPGLFNHVILQVDTGSSKCWLDATRPHQRGPLNQIYTSNFGQALLLQPGSAGLTECSPSPESMPRRKVVETYRIEAPGKDSRLEVASEYHGVSADSVRSSFRGSSKDKIQKEYLEYYARRFPKIKSAGALDYQDLPGDTGCVVKEVYTIPEIWELSEDKGKYQLTLYPNEVEQEMGTPGSSQRNDPLALNHPANITQEIHAEMFQNWTLQAAEREVKNKFFEYTGETKGTDSHLLMKWSYRTLTDQVGPADLPAYEADLRKLKDKLGYTFTYRTPVQLAGQQKMSPPPGAGQFNWPIALLLGVIVAVAAPYSVRYYSMSRATPPLQLTPDSSYLEGLGGWLILVAIGLVVRPIMLVRYTSTIAPMIFHFERWQNLTHAGQPAYHPLWIAILLFELIYNSLAFILSLLLLVMFFKKRAAFPRCFIFFMAVMVIAMVVDLVLASNIPALANGGDSATTLIQSAFGSAIWIPYCLVSRRVKATFRF